MMSSAALQSTPHQTATSIAHLGPPHPAAAAVSPPCSRHPHQSNPSPGRDHYHAPLQNTSLDTPPKRPSGIHGGNGSRKGDAHTQSQLHHLPMSSRTAFASPVPVISDQPHSSSDRRPSMPTVVPPRTSSQPTPGLSDAVSSSRQPVAHGTADRSAPHRHGKSDANGHASASQACQQESIAPASRGRRTGHIINVENPPPKPNNTHQDPKPATSPTSIPVRTSSTNQASPRQATEMLNNILVSQPDVDRATERERVALAQSHLTVTHPKDTTAPANTIDTGAEPHAGESRRTGRSRHDFSKREKHTKFGDYILGNTIGEGEFGKVRLGWKQEGGVQVAIKLIKKDQLGSNPSRMTKIMREVAILKQLTHPNIVRLHKMEESERHFGIILEYASGGELFDYILNHRYLKDNAARRLFAQLVSGVGYLHKKGIVHRDLKLENLLLDRNRNIIITDFGFANTFDPSEELTEDEENNLSDREFVKQAGLNLVKQNGMRKGDLMQTSCGSPCYAAPELVVSDSLYTGRKVDVWSCGVILYAMLAGYLPFDDDPANPEGDNINLLYKYIVNTPLTFPEYVTPHARDLLRRILVPNPRKRADLFEVARHSWLSEYAHVVEFITSSTTTPGDIQNSTVAAEEEQPTIGRSASVREQLKKKTQAPTIGGLSSKQGTVDADAEPAAYTRQQRDNKRRTVQVEYVAPNTQTQRGEQPSAYPPSSRSGARSGSHGPDELRPSAASQKSLTRDAPVTKELLGPTPVSSRRPPSAHLNHQQNMQSSRPSRETVRATSDGHYIMAIAGASGRPATGGSIGAKGYGSGRATYGQPSVPVVLSTNVPGRIQQPSGRSSNPEAPASREHVGHDGLDSDTRSKPARCPGESEGTDSKSHRRSRTIGDIGGKIFGRNGSLFGGRNVRKSQPPPGEKSKKYPPVSMTQPIADDVSTRPSIDSKRSRRSFSLGLGKKRSGSVTGSQVSLDKQGNKRFSLLPASFSMRSAGLSRDCDPDSRDSPPSLPNQEPPQAGEYARHVDQSQCPDQGDLDGTCRQALNHSQKVQNRGSSVSQTPDMRSSNSHPSRLPSGKASHIHQGAGFNSASDSSIENGQRPTNPTAYSVEQQGQDSGRLYGREPRGVLQKNKRFVDAYDRDEYSRHGHSHDHGGSSGAARRVMDFFRRRGKARGGEDR